MRMFPQSYNGFLFQNGKRVNSSFDFYDWNIAGIATSNTARKDNRPKYSGTNLGGAVKVVNVTLTEVDKDKDSLVVAMDVSGQAQYPLYALDEFGNKWYVLAKCTGLNTESTSEQTASFGYIFEIDDPTWIAVDMESDTWSITANAQTHTVTIGGNQPTRPIFRITPGASAGYYRYERYIKNYNPVGYTQTDGIDITGGGWNTAALVAAGKMLASGADVRVFLDGYSVPFWVGGGGWNNAATKLFIRATWQPGQFMALRTALAGAGTPAQIEWEVTETVQVALSKLPVSGIIRVGTEEIAYTNLSAALCQADIVQRNVRGTTIGAHSIGDVCWWVEHDIRIIYNNTAATAPVFDQTYKPVFDLTSSTNTSRVYTVFADLANLRAGSWIRQIINAGLGKLCRLYSGNHGAAAEVDPATEMGMEIASYQAQGYVRSDSGNLCWMLYHPAGFTTVTVTGEKFFSFAATRWPGSADLQSSADGYNWAIEWTEVVPASPNTWTALANTSAEAIAGYTPYIRFNFSGSIDGVLNNFSRMEIDSCTVVLNSANVIQVGMSGELDNYQFAIEIRNTTTGESLYVNYPVEPGDVIVIDTEAMTVTYKGLNAIRAISWDTIRADWLKLVAGPNILQYFSNPTGTISLVTQTHNKAL